jgi:predicted RNA-binding Zn-ribbon protein involved in translation (DUF1610 family)
MVKFDTCWNKKKREWDINVADLPKDFDLTKFSCPICEKPLSGGEDEFNECTQAISIEDFHNLSLNELKAKIEFRCGSCYEKVPLAKFDKRFQNLYEMTSIEPRKKIYSLIHRASIIHKGEKEFHIGIVKLISLGRKAGDLGIEIVCGSCGNKNSFVSINTKKEDNIIQCLECGYLNKIEESK